MTHRGGYLLGGAQMAGMQMGGLPLAGMQMGGLPLAGLGMAGATHAKHAKPKKLHQIKITHARGMGGFVEDAIAAKHAADIAHAHRSAAQKHAWAMLPAHEKQRRIDHLEAVRHMAKHARK